MKPIIFRITPLLLLPLIAGCAAQTELLRSIHAGDTAGVKRLLDGGVPVSETGGCKPDDGFETTPLLCAINQNRAEIVRLLLDKGAAVNENGEFGETPLIVASEQDIELVKLLVDRGADIHGRGEGWIAGRTPLMSAAVAGKIDIVKLLLDRGAKIDARNDRGWTALSFAAASNQVVVAKVLISRGADTDYAISKAETYAGEVEDSAVAAKHRAEAEMLKQLRSTVMVCRRPYRRDVVADAAFGDAAAKFRSLRVKPGLPEEAREYRIQAEYAFRQQMFQKAVDLYDKALKISPWWPDGYFNQALILGEMHCPEEAIAAMSKYITLVPDAPDARAARDKIYEWKLMVP